MAGGVNLVRFNLPRSPKPEVQALRDKAEELADDVRNLSDLIHSLRAALVGEGLVMGGV